MSRSQLAIALQVHELLAQNPELSIKEISIHTKTHWQTARRTLEFLVALGVAQERTIASRRGRRFRICSSSRKQTD